jgi:hypothetical protein
MARLITRMADLCRRRAAEDRFLRRFGMQPADANDDGDAAGPGWYESSRELQTGLLVRECPVGEALYAEWQALSAPPPRARA